MRAGSGPSRPMRVLHSDCLCFAAKPDVTLTIADSDLVDMMSGRLNSQKAFFQGKLKVSKGLMGSFNSARPFLELKSKSKAKKGSQLKSPLE